MQQPKSPLVWIVFFFIHGIFLGWVFNPSPLVVLLSICLYAFLFYLSHKTWCFYIAILLMGMWRIAIVQENSFPQIQEEKILIKIQGILVSTPFPLHWIPGQSEYEQFSKNPLFVEATHFWQNSQWIQANQAGIKIFYEGNPYSLKRGDFIQATGWLSIIPEPSNPGENNKRAFWKAKQIDYQMVVTQDNIHVLGNGGCPILNFFSRLRLRYIEILRESVGYKQGNIIAALLLGARRLLEEDTLENFQKTGLLHLLAISGTHVSIVAWLVYQALLRFLFPFQFCHASVIILCFLYAMLTDMQAPVVRSVIMISVHIFATLIGRKAFAINSLSLSAMIILWFNPLDLMQPGFSLSFCACLAIFKLYLPISSSYKETSSQEKKLYFSFFHYLKEANLVSWIAWIGTAPLLAYYFYQINPFGAVFTVILMPMVTMILALSILLLFSFFGMGWTALFLSYSLNKVVSWMEILVDLFAHFPFVCFSIIPPLLFFVLIFYFFILFCPFEKVSQYFCFLILFFLVFLSVCLRPMALSETEMTVLSVGNGGAIYIRLPGGKNLLYDCGSMDKQAGTKIIVPFLLQKGIFELDAVVLSHYDSDHYNAFDDLVSFIKIKKIYINKAFQEKGEKILDLAKRLSMEIIQAKDNSIAADLPGIVFLYPGQYLKIDSLQEDNEHSLMLLVDLKGTKILLTADIGPKSLGFFLDQKSISVDILQLPHHGSYVPQIENLVQNLKPKMLFLCAHGRFNIQKTLQFCQSIKIPLAKTYQDGALFFHFSPKGSYSWKGFKNKE